MEPTLIIVITVAMASFAQLFFILFIVKALLCICRPDELLVLTGRTHRDATGQIRGYRVISGGRTIRLPIIEGCQRLRVSALPLTFEAKGVFVADGESANITGLALVHISKEPAITANAVERFLGRSDDEIRAVARETLEGVLRQVVASFPLEDLMVERERLLQQLSVEASEDLRRLGLELAHVSLTEVTDTRGRLDNAVRKMAGQAIRDAELRDHELVTDGKDAPTGALRERSVPTDALRDKIDQISKAIDGNEQDRLGGYRIAPSSQEVDDGAQSSTPGGAVAKADRLNPLVIISGRQERAPASGLLRGYCVAGGSGWRKTPLIEVTNFLDTSEREFSVELRQLRTTRFLPVSATVKAKLAIAVEPPEVVDRAATHLLRRSDAELEELCRVVITGEAARVLANTDPSELALSLDEVSKQLREACQTLQSIGIEVLEIELVNVHDDWGYLDAVRRLDRLSM